MSNCYRRGNCNWKNTYISSKKKNQIFIEKLYVFKKYKYLSSDGHKIYQNSNRINLQKHYTIIEDNVWLADNVVLLKGTFISEGSIVGTGTVVINNLKKRI